MKIKLIILTIAILVIFIFSVNLWIYLFSSNFIIKDLKDLPKKETALVLGSSAFGDILKDRAETALFLYNQKKVDSILISGDHSKNDYDEVSVVEQYLREEGVENIITDSFGLDTFDSLYRAKNVFKKHEIIIVTQDFHLSRALFLARKLGIESYGFSSSKKEYPNSNYNQVREFFANIKAFFDILLKSKPKYE